MSLAEKADAAHTGKAALGAAFLTSRPGSTTPALTLQRVQDQRGDAPTLDRPLGQVAEPLSSRVGLISADLNRPPYDSGRGVADLLARPRSPVLARSPLASWPGVLEL